MEKDILKSVVAVMIGFAFLVNGLHAAENPALKPAAGEKKLEGADAEKAIAELAAAFQKNPSVSAKVSSTVEDDLDIGKKRAKEGTLLLDRPARLLRSFTKPSPSAWLLDGTQIHEYVPKLGAVYIKNFANAPKKLRMLQAAVTVDVKELGAMFDVHIFEKAGAAGKEYRLLLIQKAEKGPVIYKHIQTRIAAGAPFFHEIEYLPTDGGKVTETYTEIQAIAKPKDEAFALNLAADTKREETAIDDNEK